MKKFLFAVIFLGLSAAVVSASEFPAMKCKNISFKSKISYNQETGVWNDKVNKNDENVLTKKESESGGIYVRKDGTCAFSTGCDYEFISDGKLIGYSNNELKFIEFKNDDGVLTGEDLSPEEIQPLIPSYKIVKISEFSDKTNVYKIKKHAGPLRIFIFNDTDKTFENYQFTSGNAEFKKYDLNGFVDISKKGMVEFSAKNGIYEGTPWYVLLVR